MWITVGVVTVVIAAAWVGRQAESLSRPRAPSAAAVPSPLATDISSEMSPSLSPDGTEVVYFWRRPGGHGLYIKPVTGGPPRMLTVDGLPEGATPRRPRWSPAGDLVSFQVIEAPDVRGIYTVGRGGGIARRLTNMAGIGQCWSPDGRTIAYADRAATGEPLAIFSRGIDSGIRRRLTVAPPGSFGDTECAFSPDGSTLAVARYLSRFQSDVYLAPLTGPEAAQGVQLTADVEGITGLDWSPDGSMIVFATHTGLWQVAAAPDRHDKPTPVIRVAGASTASPAFSRPPRNGVVRMAYEHNVRDVNVWRWRLGPVGREEVSRFEGSTWWDDHPAISPDGRRVAFASNRSGSGEIWLARDDGSQPVQLTFHGGPVVVSPQWSPDQTRIAYTSQAGGNRDVFVTGADGTRSERLTWESSQEEFPSWSRDGRSIYFKSNRGGSSGIWKLRLGAAAPVRITTGEASQAFESPDGTLVFFTRSGDAPGLWAVPSSGGAEQLVLPDVRESFWGVADGGIAYVAADSQPRGQGTPLWFYDFATRTKQRMGTIPAGRTSIMPGFAVAKDGRSVLWTSLDVSQSDVMVFDPWK